MSRLRIPSSTPQLPPRAGRGRERLTDRLTDRLVARDAARFARREERAAAREARRLARDGMPRLSGWGAAGPAAGRRRPLRLPPLVATTAQLCVAYPWAADPGLGVGGPLIGIDALSGGLIAFAPHELYRAGVVTAPNICVTGALGTAKSALAKCLAVRLEPFGVPAAVVDRRNEYEPVARLIGMERLRVGAGLGARLNPLQGQRRRDDQQELEWWSQQRSQRLLLVEGLLEVQLGRALQPAEKTLLAYALDAVTGADDTSPSRRAEPALGPLSAAAVDPTRWQHRLAEVGYPLEQFQVDARAARLALAELVTGSLSTLFARDAHEATRIRLGERGTCVDISAVRQSGTAAVLAVACAQAALEAELADPRTPASLCVLDELALLVASPALAARLRERLKLTRATGTANILIFHRFSELEQLGGAGSEHARTARGLVEDCGVRISYAQPHGSQAQAQEWMGLSDAATELLGHLRPGVGVWAIGDRVTVVAHQLSSVEYDVVQTHSRMYQQPDRAGLDDTELQRRLDLVRAQGVRS
jgi:hypothetical protein